MRASCARRKRLPPSRLEPAQARDIAEVEFIVRVLDNDVISACARERGAHGRALARVRLMADDEKVRVGETLQNFQ